MKDGFTVSLASDAATEKGVDVPCPVEWAMVRASQSGATDRIAYPCIHGAGATHLDSFAHVFFGGKMWNGYAVSELVTKEGGAAKNSILTIRNGIVTRGVLYDIPRLRPAPPAQPGVRFQIPPPGASAAQMFTLSSPQTSPATHPRPTASVSSRTGPPAGKRPQLPESRWS